MRSKNKKALFLDRDGVINKVIFREGKVSSPWKLEEFEFLPGIKELLWSMKEKGFLNIVVTNQPDIKRGFLNIEALEKMHRILRENFPIEEIKICPHDDDDNCFCRKPKPGLIFEAAEKYLIDLKNSFMIGDGWKDIVAGKTAGCKTVFIRTDYNKEIIYNKEIQNNCDFIVDNLEEIYKIIKNENIH
jgi:D-glycero-D-manno-heptose 1,7-bisphosphate phosphatase